MCPQLIHLYGPVWIASYGVMIALGFFVFLLCTQYHPIRKKFIQESVYQNALFLGLLSGIIGGRVFAVLLDWRAFADNWVEIFFPWTGGFMVLGSIVGVLLVGPWYLWRNNVSIFPILDLAALYAPLMQSIARFGCFFSGCCYGMPVVGGAWYAVKFSDPAGSAPLGVWLHPTQLYAVGASFIIFMVMHIAFRTIIAKRGQLISLYLMLESFARIAVDFWRDDRGELLRYNFFNFHMQLSQAQKMSGILLIVGSLLFIWVSITQQNADYRKSSL